MMIRSRFLVIIILLSSSCIRSSQVQEKVVSKICCLDRLLYIPNDSLLAPAFVRMKLINCDSTLTKDIESVMFPEIPVKDTSLYDFGLWSVEQLSPDTAIIVLDTYYYTDSGLSKDSIEHMLSERIGIVTSQNDTVYLDPCNK